MKEANLNIYWEKAFAYTAFRALMHELHEKKMVTGPNQSDDLLAYSLLNEQRMNRIDKHGSIQGVTQSAESLRILVITEGWCGDSAQILPYMEKWSAAKGHQLRIVLRDENLDLMDQYLTNGARAVPLFLFLDAEGKVVARWGARPETLQNLVVNWKNEGLTKEVFVTMIHKWYADDKGMTCVQEWEELSFTH